MSITAERLEDKPLELALAPEELGVRKAENFVAFLLGEYPGNNEDTDGNHQLIKGFLVNDPDNEAESAQHAAFIDALGFDEAKPVDSHFPELIHADSTCTVKRQVIAVPEIPGAAYVTYMGESLPLAESV